MATFYRWVSTASRLFTTKFPEIPGAHFIDLGGIEGRVDLCTTQGFEHETSELGIQHLNH